MKKILLALIMVMLLASPALAGQVTVNGITYLVDTIEQDGRIFVPLRFVAETLGAAVNWTGYQAEVTTMKRPEIIGDKIVPVVTQALDLLEKQDYADYVMICTKLRVVKYDGKSLAETQSDGSVTYAKAVGGDSAVIGSDFVNDTELFNSISMAGVLVHETVHLANDNRVTSAQDENLAYLREISVLRAIEAPQRYVDITEQSRLKTLKRLSK